MHECAYADLVGLEVKFIKDSETGRDVCCWCHEPKYTAPKKAAQRKKVENV